MTTEALFADAFRSEDRFVVVQKPDPAGVVVMPVGEEHIFRQSVDVQSLTIFFKCLSCPGIEEEFFPVPLHEEGEPMLRRQTGQSMVFDEDGTAHHIRGTRRLRQPAGCVHSS